MEYAHYLLSNGPFFLKHHLFSCKNFFPENIITPTVKGMCYAGMTKKFNLDTGRQNYLIIFQSSTGNDKILLWHT